MVVHLRPPCLGCVLAVHGGIVGKMAPLTHGLEVVPYVVGWVVVEVGDSEHDLGPRDGM